MACSPAMRHAGLQSGCPCLPQRLALIVSERSTLASQVSALKHCHHTVWQAMEQSHHMAQRASLAAPHQAQHMRCGHVRRRTPCVMLPGIAGIEFASKHDAPRLEVECLGGLGCMLK